MQCKPHHYSDCAMGGHLFRRAMLSGDSSCIFYYLMRNRADDAKFLCIFSICNLFIMESLLPAFGFTHTVVLFTSLRLTRSETHNQAKDCDFSLHVYIAEIDLEHLFRRTKCISGKMQDHVPNTFMCRRNNLYMTK